MKKRLMIFALFGVAVALFAEPEREHFRRGPGMWEVFSHMSESERAEMMKLQREDPEAFRKSLETRAEKLYQEKLQKRAELQKLIDAYQATADPAQKAEIQKQLQAKIGEGFDQRLADHRRHLAEMKRRTAEFEKKLETRAADRDAIVEKMTSDLLSGKMNLPLRRFMTETHTVFSQEISGNW